MAVFESGYNQIRLKFNSVGKIAGKLPDQEQPSADSKSGPLMYVRINEKRGIYGSLKDFETFSIKTQFGKVKIPTSEIAGIRFNDGSADTAFVVLKKGDVFSGQIDLETITVASRFGEQKLKLTRVESLSLGRQFVFLRDAINSKRWRLQSLLPAPSPTINPNFNRNPNGLSPITVDPSQLNSAPSVLFPQQPIGPNQRPIGFPN